MSSTGPKGRIVVVDDDPGGRQPLVRALERSGHDVVEYEDVETALADGGPLEDADVVVTDIRMPGKDGLSLLQEVKGRWPDKPVIVITGFGSIASSFEAGRLGADVYLEKPLDIHELRRRVGSLLSRESGDGESSENELLPGLIGASESMKELAEQVRLAAPTQATVLIMGESGTGKDLIANAVHLLSDRKDETFLPINCAAIPGHLLESELFGHEKGAFTGAVARQPGKFEQVGNGTLFLDEIGELALDLQAKLLRVLEDRRFTRVGGTATVQFAARLVAASNRDLPEAVAAGDFREDLYYRLKVVSLESPPLRERKADIAVLARSFLRDFAAFYGKEGMSFAPELIDRFEALPWTGNVRELRNLIESLVVLSRSSSLSVTDLPASYRKAEIAQAPPGQPAESAPQTMDAIERSAILAALAETKGNRERAAKQLGIGLRTLQRKIKEYRADGVDI